MPGRDGMQYIQKQREWALFIKRIKVLPDKNKHRMSLHPEVKPIYRKDVQTADRITQPYYTKYEFTALVAVRAQQISDGAKPLVSLDGLRASDPMFVWNVARREIEERKLPFIIRRQLPNNTMEFWSAMELEVI